LLTSVPPPARPAGKDKGLLAPLVAGYPELEAEVVHAVRAEYCSRPEDFLARRSRLAFLDVAAARAAVPRVAELMGKELGWSAARRKRAAEEALEYLDTFST
jgi:glycerol-3-phosphate dehydrogenase